MVGTTHFGGMHMLWKELEGRIYTILKNIDLTDREKAELILIEFNQYEPTAKTLK